MDLIEQGYIIVTGFIDAKDDRDRTVYGSMIAFVSRRDNKFISVLFSKEEPDKELDWGELLTMHKAVRETAGRDPSLIHNEEELYTYLNTGNILNKIAKNHNTKQAEQSISRYCIEQLQLKAVSFVDFAEASDSDFRYMEATLGSSREKDALPPDEPEESPDQETLPGDAVEKSAADIFIRCNPILDPVSGKAMSELKIGDQVYGRLPEDSVFHKLLTKNFGSFDGMITANVTGILLNELGTATVSLELSDGIAGIMKLSGSVKIKVPSGINGPGGKGSKSRKFRLTDLSTELVFGIAGSIILISALIMIYYVFK